MITRRKHKQNKEGIAAHWAVVPSLFFSLIMIYYYALPTSELWHGEEGCQMPGNSFLLSVCAGVVACAIWYYIQKWLER